MNLLCENSAVNFFLKKMHIVPLSIIPINKDRYAIIRVNPEKTIALLLKTEPYYKFGEKFSEYGECGAGDSINCKHLKTMLEHDVERIYTVFRDGKIYRIGMQHMLRHSYKWTQKEDTEVRSFSLKHYNRVIIT